MHNSKFSYMTGLLPSLNLHNVRHILAEAKRQGVVIRIITLTGGPLAGKSTGLIRIAYDMSRRGWFVVSVPEAATIIRSAGFTAETGAISNYGGQRAMVYTGETLFMQMLVEAISAGHKQILIVRDRSSVDCAAYMDSYDQFVALLDEMGISVSELNHSDKTIFLDSLGVDDPELYAKLCSNNAVRHEDAAQAATANKKLVAAYEHFGFVTARVGNKWSDGVEGKNRALVNYILQLVGEPPIQSQAAYAVKVNPGTLASALGSDFTRSARITQFYYDGWRYCEVLGPDNRRVYVATQKTRKDDSDPTVRYKEERYINSGEFFSMLRLAKEHNIIVVQKNRCYLFFGKGDRRNLVTIDSYHHGLNLPDPFCRVEIDSPEEGQGADFLTGYEHLNVTGQLQHSDEGLCTNQFVYPF